MPRAVEGWEIEGEIGRGAFGTVLRAKRLADGAVAALKIPAAGDRLARLQLEAERQALAAVGPPAVPGLLGSGTLDDGTPWIALELIELPTLENLITAGRLPGEPVAALGLSILEALERVHAAGFLHLDLKPANVFVQLHPARARLFDLGLARPLGAAGPVAPELKGAGTAEYMAPEQCEGKQVSVRTDVYAAGTVLFDLLAGRPPFTGPPGEVKQAHLGLRPPRPSRLRGHAVPVGLEEVALRCLAKDPAQRYGSAADLRAAWAAASPPPWAPPSWPPPKGPGDAPAPEPRPQAGPPAERRSAGLVFFIASGITPAAVASEVEAAGARVGSAVPPRYVAVVAPERSEHAVREALAVAQALCGRGLTARAVVDVGPVAVQKRPGGSVRYVSTAFARGEHFPRESDPPGPLLAADAAVLLPEVPTAPAGRGDLRRPLGAPEAAEATALQLARTPLVGRAELLDALAAEAEAALAGAAPGIAVVVAEAGLGKSRLGAALVERLCRALPDAEVIDLRAPEPVAGGGEGLLRVLLERLLGTLDEAAASATRAEPGRTPSARQLLGERLRARLRALGPQAEAEFGPALGLALGLVGADQPEVRALAAAPGAVRALQLRGAGELLRARARARPLCLVIDDAHHGDDAALDALEYAALAEAGAPIWIAVLARPPFAAARPSFGERAARSRRDVLGGLQPEQAAELCRVLLEPATNVPAEAVARLVQRAQGVPLLLVELVRGLQREGLVQRRPGGAWVLATDELDRLPDLPLVEWLAERELGALPPELAAHARLIALLGAEVRPDEVVGVVEVLERDGAGAALPLDALVGMRRLRAAGVLVPARDGMVRMRHALVRDAVVKATPGGFRLAAHRAAHRFYQAESSAPEERRLPLLALHAAACGLRDEAARSYLELAGRARVRHAYLEAERACTRALELFDAADNRRRLLALHARASTRYRIGRSEDALADFAAARALAAALHDADALVDLLLEEATALDWGNDFVRSAALVAEAQAQAARLPDRSELRSARLALGAGRGLFRAGDWESAADMLDLAAQLAAGCGDPGYETQVIALTLLQVVLPQLGRVEESEQIAEQAIALCRSHGDQLHLASAIGNRRNLLVARKDLAACIADQQTFMRIGRELGMVISEYAGQFNLGEIHYQAGDAAAAAPHVARAVEIEERHPEVAQRPAALLLRARVHAWSGRHAEARAERERILFAVARAAAEGRVSGALTPSEAVLVELVDCATRAASPAEWDELVARSARDSMEQELLEVLELRALRALAAGRRGEAREALARARAEAARIPNLFDERLRRVEAAIAAAEMGAAG